MLGVAKHRQRVPDGTNTGLREWEGKETGFNLAMARVGGKESLGDHI